MQVLTKSLKYFFVLTMVTALFACGGGGGGSNPTSTGGGSTGGGGTGGGSTTPVTPSIDQSSVVLNSQSTGAAVSSASFGESTQVTVALTDGNGGVLNGATVDFSFDVPEVTAGVSNKVVASGSTTSDANGVVVIPLVISDPNVAGDGVLTLNITTTDGVQAQSTLTIPVVGVANSPARIVLRLLNNEGEESNRVVTTNASANRSTLEISVLDAFGSLVEDVPVTLDRETSQVLMASSLLSGSAVVSTPVEGVPGGDALAGTITASLTINQSDGAPIVLSSSVPFQLVQGSIVDPTAESINFVSVSEATLAINGGAGGGSIDSSVVTFTVVDAGNVGVGGVDVTFALQGALGGVTLDNTTAVTDSQGLVSVEVTSGNSPTTFSVLASLSNDTSISENSSSIVVQSGAPQQGAFGLSASLLNPGGDSVNGVETEIFISASDIFNNPVADGARVIFTTEYGAIDPSCTTVNGQCSAVWRSQEPREPQFESTGNVRTIFDQASCVRDLLNTDGSVVANVPTSGLPCEDPFGQILGGRSTVSAIMVGDEFFNDANQNGFYDAGEPFVDLPEAFVDHNEDGVFGNDQTAGACTDASGACSSWETGGAEETFSDINSNQQYDAGDGVYTGSRCRAESAAAGICSNESVNVRDDIVIYMSGSRAYGVFQDADNRWLRDGVDVTDGPKNIEFLLSDRFNGPLVAGTTVSITSENCTVSGLGDDGSVTLSDTNGTGPTVLSFLLRSDNVVGASSAVGLVTAAVEVPNQQLRFFTLPCADQEGVFGDPVDQAPEPDQQVLGTELVSPITGLAVTSVSNSSPARLVVTLSTEVSGPLENQTVNLTSQFVNLSTATESPVNGVLSLTTDSNGQVEVDVTSTGVAEISDAIVITSEGAAATVNVAIQNEIILNLTNTSGDTTSVTSSAPGLLTATLLDPSGNPLSGELIDVSTDVGSLDIGGMSGRILTDAAGQATVSILAGTTLGAGTVTATSGAASSSFNFAILNSTDAPTSSVTLALSLVSAVDGSAINNQISNAESGTLLVTIMDTSNPPAPVSNAIVVVQSDLGSIEPTSGRIVTDNDGVARLTVARGTAEIGEAGTLAATYTNPFDNEDVVASLNFSIISDVTEVGEPTSLQLSLTDASANTIQSISQDVPGLATVLVTDTDGNPVASQIVTFSTSLGSLSPSSGSALTGPTGIAVADLTVGDAESGDVGLLTVVLGDLTESIPFTIADVDLSGEPATLGLTLVDSAGNTNISVPQDSPATLRIQVNDALGAGVASQTISVATNLGDLAPSTGSVLTDNTGLATIDISTAGLEVGSAGTLTVTLGGLNESINFEVVAGSGVSTEPFNIGLALADSAGTTTTSISSAAGATLTVTLTDGSGAVISGELINVATSLGQLSPSSGNVRTNATGQATVALVAGNASVGEGGIITATYVDADTSAEFTSTITFDVVEAAAQAGEPENLVLDLQNSAGATIRAINATTPGTLVLTLTDINGDPVADQIVQVASSLGDISPASGAVLTDAAGQATVAVEVGTATAGAAGLITAQIGTVEAELPFEVAEDSAVGGTVNSIGLSMVDAGGNATRSVAEDNPGTFRIQINDALGVGVANQLVSVASSLGELSVNSGSILTDATGLATIVVSRGTAEVGEAGTITVSVDSISETFNFSIAASVGGNTDAFTVGLALEDLNTSAATTSISSADPGQIIVTLTDASSAAVVGQVVSVTSSIGLVSPASGNIRTDATGQATISLTVGSAVVGEGGTITATFTDPETGSDFTSTFTFDVVEAAAQAGEPENLVLDLQNSAGATIRAINATTPGTLVLTLTDINGDPVADQIVQVDSSLGAISPASGAVLTDATGEATVSVEIGTATAGSAGLITAQIGAVAAELPFEIAEDAAVGGTVTSIGISMVDSGGASTREIAEDSPGILRVQVNDALGAGIANQLVNVTTSLGSLSVASGDILTDATGLATIEVSRGTADIGEAGTISVSADTLTETFNFSVVASAGGSTDAFTVGLALESLNTGAATTSISSVDPGQITVTLTDASNALIAGQVVNVSSTIGLLSPASGNVLTDASGQATLTINVGSSSVGEGGTLTATFTDSDNIVYTETLTFEIVSAGATAGEPATLTAQLEDPDAAGIAITSISSNDPGILILTVLDGSGNAVVGEIVSVTTTLGNITPASGNVLTDTNGVAEVDVLVGAGQPGEAGTLTATINELESTLNFEIVDSGTVSTAGFTIETRLYDSDFEIDNVVDIDNVTNSSITSTVNAVESGFLLIRVTETLSGLSNPVVGAILTVTTTAGTISPSTGQVLTDSNGFAVVQVGPGDVDAGAAVTLTATLEDVSVSTNLSIGSVELDMGFDTDANTVIAGAEIGVLGIGGTVTGTSATALQIGSTGSTSVTVTVVDSTGAAFSSAPLTVNFTSQCVANGDATISDSVTTVAGVASATYEATGCEGIDEITATIEEVSGISATGFVEVLGADANSIQFVSAAPSSIAIQGTGGTGRQEFATLVFRVIDEAGRAISGELVSAALSTTIGGVNLTGDTDSDGDLDDSATDERLTTNSQGEVSIIVNSGTVPTAVRVNASILVGGETISTVSDVLVVSTGLPDQNSFSLSAETLNPGGFSLTGIEDVFTLRAADAFNNPVPDGTAISFTTEYGRIGDSCTTEDGACTVTWNSQNPRSPDLLSTGTVLRIDELECDNNADGTGDNGGAINIPCINPLVDPADIDFPGQIFGGRSSVLAYAIGEESFVDANGNGFYDWIETNGNDTYEPGVDILERFTDLGEAFVDHNEDGVFGNELTAGACTGIGVGSSIPAVVDINDIDSDGDTTETLGAAEICANWEEGGAEEEFIDFDVDGIYDYGNGIYNGSLCHPDVEAAGNCTQELVSVRSNVDIIVGGSEPFIGIHDSLGNYLPNPSVDVSGGPITRTVYVSDVMNGFLPAGTEITVAVDNCEILGTDSYEIPNTNVRGIYTFSFGLGEDDSTDDNSGTVEITVTPPDGVGGVAVSSSFTCVDLN